MTSSLPTDLDPASSVLFLGSGFTRAALNIRDERIPTGAELKNKLAEILSVPSSDYDLKVLAEELASSQDANLPQLLYELFTVKEIDPDQLDILKNRWLRIYTTNYDDTVEFAQSQLLGSLRTYNYDDPKPRRLEPNSIIHLHGSIRRLTNDNLLEQLILTEQSYVRLHFEQSQWYDDFTRDLRFSRACFFLGYSLSDHHIASLLLQNPAVVAKTFFISQTDPDRLFLNRVRPYGEVLPIGVQGFAELCRTLPRPTPLADPYTLKSFRYIDPHKDRKSLTPPTALEVFSLLTFGTFNYTRSLSAQPGQGYVVSRERDVAKAADLLGTNRCLLILSRLGNGKTIFIHLLAIRLAERGYRCFIYHGESPTIEQELSLLRSMPKVAMLIDSYTQSQDAIQHLAHACPEAKFVVTVRTGVHDVRLHEIDRDLPRPFERLNANLLTSQDIDEFAGLCKIAGVGEPGVERLTRTNRELRDLLIVLFESPYIQRKVTDTFAELFADSKMKRVMLGLFLISWAGEEAEPSFLRAVTQVDAFREMARARETAGEILKLEDEQLQVRSPVFAEFVMQHLAKAEDVVESIYNIVARAALRKNERRYRVIMARLTQFANLRKLLREYPEQLGLMENLYERLRHHGAVNDDPLFWLQYGILMIEIDNLLAADEFLSTAYARAALSPGFKTYQIDTQACRLVLLWESRDVASPTVRRFDEVREKAEVVTAMINEESHRYYAIKVLEDVPTFVKAREPALSIGEANVLVYLLARIVDALEGLSPDVRAQTASDRLLNDVRRAKEGLLRITG